MPDAAPDITLAAPAKINLALSVGGRQSGGYHPLASWMLAVDLCDTVSLHRVGDRAGAEARFDIAFSQDAPLHAGEPISWPIEQDLAARAHRALEAEVGHPLPIRATIRKRVPPGMGLGGGSSDAAAILVALNQCFELRINPDRLMTIAATLGSDVPFLVSALMRGEPAAVITGIGERCDPMPLKSDVALVLVMPALACSSGEVYRAFDRLHPDAREPAIERVRTLARAGVVEGERLFNDLAPPAIEVEPRLGETIEQIRPIAGRPVQVTGSGAGLFIVCQSPRQGDELAWAIQQATGLVTRPSPPLPTRFASTIR